MRLAAGCLGAVLLQLLARQVAGRARAPRYWDVDTSQGTVRGYLLPRPPHFVFLGIPYAHPPTRRARFKPPAPPVRWDGIFEATHKIKCLQPDGTGDENCLVINVFAPEHSTSSPVLVYFHGGGFQKGWGFHNAPLKLIYQDIIIVSFNYRLGALGFLSLTTPGISGNAGLKDQVAALYWLQRNIAKFGGNPSKITVYGTGSGAASIEYLMLTNVAKNLFQRAILEDGSALSPSSKYCNMQELAFQFAHNLGFIGDTTEKAEEFYYSIPKKKIANESRLFLPCVEKLTTLSLIDEDPWKVIRRGKFYHIPIMIVFTMAEEATVLLRNTSMYKAPKLFSTLIPNNIKLDTPTNEAMIIKYIEDFYFGQDELTSNNNALKSYIDYFNDVFLIFPIVKSAVHHALDRSKHIFLMHFSYESTDRNRSHSIKGARYGDIFKYLSNNDIDGNEVTEKLTILWSNFIKLGDPTPLTTTIIPESWQPVKPHIFAGKPVLRGIQCLKFSVTETMYNDELNNPQLMFWDKVYDSFYKY